MPKIKLRNREFEEINDDCTSYLGQNLYAISRVETVFISLETEYIDVWIVIPKRDVQIMEQIFEVDKEIVGKFSLTKRSPLFFDFHVVYRDGSDEKELVSDKAVLLPKRYVK